MGRYVAGRLLLALPTLLMVAVLAFVLLRIVPGDPAILMLGEFATPEDLARVRAELGLDRSLPVQFLHWLRDVVQFDFGTSIVSGEPVATLMLDRFAVTAQVVVLATLLAALIAVPAGTIAAWKQDSVLDRALVGFAVLCLSVPSFWVGLLLIVWFGVKLQWLPTVGFVSPFVDFSTGIQYLLLPVLALVLVQCGSLLRMARSSAIEVLRLEYVSYARAKGVPEWQVLARHVLPNALLPTLSLLGVILGTLLAGAAVIETVFTLPGIGRLLVESIFARDYPVVQGVVVLVGMMFVLINLAVDLVYPLLDPRVRLG